MLIWPISDLYLPLVHELQVDGVVNSFGSGYEQRIITDIPRGPRADGEGKQSIYVGTNIFQVTFSNLRLLDMSVPTNVHVNNSVRALWKFYKACFYDASTGQIFWRPFFFYSLLENDAVSTWTGSVNSAGINLRGEAVTNLTGRYLVRFSESTLSIDRFRHCLFSGSLTLIEVAA